MLKKTEYWVQPQYAYNFLDSIAFYAYKMFSNIDSIAMVSLIGCTVHASQGGACHCFAKRSVNEKPKIIYIF